MAQKCALCNLEYKNEEQLKEHLAGKKHKKFESIKQEREECAKRSLFVSNLKKDTFVKHLEEYFLKFGKINKTVIDSDKNAYAIIEYENEESVEKALESKEEHKVNGKNLKIARRELKEFVARSATNADKKKELLEKSKEEALVINTILGKCDSFEEQVDKLIEHLELESDHLKLRESICDNLNKIFNNYWNQDEAQVSIFGSTLNGLACKGSDMDMTLLLKDYFPNNTHKQQKLPKIKVKQPVSNQNNPQDNSDSNMTECGEAELEEDVDLDDNNNDKSVDADSHNSLKASIVQFFNEKNYKKFLEFEIDHQIKIVGKIIQRMVIELKTLRTITNTRCPVVRFFHEKANIFCDLSLNNYLACENTKLIKLYMCLEPNLRRMIFVVRYWMKQKNLYSSNRFNSYTIIWLIIFYMQKKNVGYLPTVNHLSKMTDQANEIHGWNCAFETNIDKIKSTNQNVNTSPIGVVSNQIDSKNFNDLLKGFFEFYSTFEFKSNSSSSSFAYTICTQTAELIRESEKTELSKLSPFINIQDPFDLSHNLTANISKNTLERFISECQGSNDILQYSKQPRKALNKCWGLILLVTKKSLPITNTTKSNNLSKELIEKSLVKLKLVDDKAQHDENNANDSNKDQHIPVREAIEFVLFLLKDCLLFEELTGDKLISKKRKRLKILNQICDQVDSLGLNCSPKRLKTSNNASNDPSKPSNTYVCMLTENINNNEDDENENGDEEHTANKEKLLASYQFCVKKNTWQSRRSVRRELNKSNSKIDGLELEKLISQKLIEINSNKPELVSKDINFRILFVTPDLVNDEQSNNESNNNKISHLQIRFDLLDETKNQNDLINFTSFVHFLDIYINNSQEKLFNHWKEFGETNLKKN